MALEKSRNTYERILLNLLSNAIKFTHKGHGIYIHISCRRRKVTVTIRDEGIGIQKASRKMILNDSDRWTCSLSRQAEGTGIGVS
jgi:signal transduction histidine kinase